MLVIVPENVIVLSAVPSPAEKDTLLGLAIVMVPPWVLEMVTAVNDVSSTSATELPEIVTATSSLVLAALPTVLTTASLAPVMGMVMVADAVVPPPSDTVATAVSVPVWPSVSASVSESLLEMV